MFDYLFLDNESCETERESHWKLRILNFVFKKLGICVGIFVHLRIYLQQILEITRRKTRI